MSIKSAKAFVERIKNDEDFRKSVGEIDTVEERIEFVKRAGFDFTKEELDSVVPSKLSDDDLKQIAAAGDYCWQHVKKCCAPRGWKGVWRIN